jgi:hypothetical protein
MESPPRWRGKDGIAEGSRPLMPPASGFNRDQALHLVGLEAHRGRNVDFATFDADVARLVDGDLNPFGAIELSTSGDMGTHFFLVVDADGDGAYHANLDHVIELPNVVVPPTPDIFV